MIAPLDTPSSSQLSLQQTPSEARVDNMALETMS